MSKHFKRPCIVFVAGMGVVLATMAFDARSKTLSLKQETTCYVLASQSGHYGAAKKHRENLAPYRELSNDDIVYQTGYIMGKLYSTAVFLKVSQTDVARVAYEDQCIKKA